MIQRIQSVWLLLASACAFLSLKLPFYSGTQSKGLQYEALTGSSGILLLLITVIIGLLALFTIFIYKKRIDQQRLCIAGIFLEALLIYIYFREISGFTTGTYSLTAILQSGVLLFFVLAIRGINTDEKLVKDSNKLR